MEEEGGRGQACMREGEGGGGSLIAYGTKSGMILSSLMLDDVILWYKKWDATIFAFVGIRRVANGYPSCMLFSYIQSNMLPYIMRKSHSSFDLGDIFKNSIKITCQSVFMYLFGF